MAKCVGLGLVRSGFKSRLPVQSVIMGLVT